MVRIVVDKEVRERLGGLDDPLELFNENGRALGRFLPVRESKLADVMLSDVEAQCPYTPEELAALQARGGGRPLAEIWKELGQG